jgi:hypothetical protein
LKALFVLLMVLMATLAASFPLTSVYGQLQLPATQQEGEPEVESDGGLTATLNGVTFGKGNTVSLSGTVEERDSSARMYAKLIDPDGIELSTNRITVGSDLTFRYGFVAGEDRSEMTKAGAYTLQIEYFPPGDPRIESVTLDFEYNPEASQATGGAPSTEATTNGNNISGGSSKIMNMGVINQSTAQAIRYAEQANTAIQNNDTQGASRDLNLALNELENIQGNLTLFASESSGQSTNIDTDSSTQTRTPSPPTPTPQQQSQQNNPTTTAPSFSNSTAPTTPSTPFTPVL